MGRSWSGTIFGEVASKANSRRIITIGARWATVGGKKIRVGGMPRVAKSDKALAFEEAAAKQLPRLNRPLEGRLQITCKIYYTWEGPDLDESLVLDVLQGRIYKNDRQVRRKIVDHGIDKENPRVVIRVEEITDDLPLMAAAEDAVA